MGVELVVFFFFFGGGGGGDNYRPTIPGMLELLLACKFYAETALPRIRQPRYGLVMMSMNFRSLFCDPIETPCRQAHRDYAAVQSAQGSQYSTGLLPTDF